MTPIEIKMIETLEILKSEFKVEYVKAEFEAEGTRTDDLMRLLDVINKSGIKLAIKIGGCEAIRDLLECKLLGIDRIIGPMIETPYSLIKFSKALKHVYSDQELEKINSLVNLETITSFNNLSSIANEIINSKIIKGFVFGRTDFCGSLGLNSDQINSDQIRDFCKKTAVNCQENNLSLTIGGGLSYDSYDFLKDVKSDRLDDFETRKIIFNSDVLEFDFKKASDLALNFELLYLTNKQDFYQSIANEDLDRIGVIKKRLKL